MNADVIPALPENGQIVACKRYFQKPKLPPDRNNFDVKEYPWCEACGIHHAPTEYAICQHCGKHHESLHQFYERVSFGNEAYYGLMARGEFLPNSPTLFNAGVEGAGTFSACFKFDVGDSLDSIMDVARKAAFVQKWGGGVGFALSDIRPKGSPIGSTHGQACGPVATLFLYQAVANLITQGGKRDGAQMAILSCDHPDIEEFIHCKDENPQALSTFNISMAATDEFMRRASTDKISREHKLLREITESAWRTGDPGLFFIDTAERANPTPHVGKLTGTNPCGEVSLMDNEPCNLGSINLTKFVRDTDTDLPHFDFDALAECVRTATAFLDDVLTHNTFPDPAITMAAFGTRKLGLGVMGWADTLAMLRIPYSDTAAIVLADEIMSMIWEESHEVSQGRASLYEAFPYQLKELGVTPRRNATTTCIAPTGTIAILAGCSSGIEPHPFLENSRMLGDGQLLKESIADRFGGFVPEVSHEIHWRTHIDHQAVFQAHTDLAVSKTINMPETATPQDIFDAYVYAWQKGCKGITIYRDRSRDTQVLTSTDAPAVERIVSTPTFANLGADEARAMHEALHSELGGVSEPVQRSLPNDVTSSRHHFNVAGTSGYIHFGEFDNGDLGEIFIRCSKQGSTIDGLFDTVAILLSLALQYGVPIETLVDKLKARRFEPSGLTRNQKIPNATSIVDYLGRLIEQKYLGSGEEEYSKVKSGMICPDCSSEVVAAEGCLLCVAVDCGWSRCG